MTFVLKWYKNKSVKVEKYNIHKKKFILTSSDLIHDSLDSLIDAIDEIPKPSNLYNYRYKVDIKYPRTMYEIYLKENKIIQDYFNKYNIDLV